MNSPSSAGPAPATPATTGPGFRLLLLVLMAVWGSNLSAVKWLMQTLEPLPASVLRMGVAAAALLLWCGWRGMLSVRPSPRQWLAMTGCAVLLVYANQILLTYGVRGTQAANAALIIALNPLVAGLMAAGLQGERLSAARLAGIAIGFAGVSAVVLNRPGAALGATGLGDALVFGAVLTWIAGGFVVQRLARGLDTVVISTWVTTIGAVMLALHVALDPGQQMPALASIDATHWAMIALSGVLATALGALVWNHALRTIGVARTALYAYWVPIFGVGFAIAALGEPLSVWHGIGLAAVLAGTWLGTRR